MVSLTHVKRRKTGLWNQILRTHSETDKTFSKTKGSPAPGALGRGTFRPLLKTLSASECVLQNLILHKPVILSYTWVILAMFISYNSLIILIMELPGHFWEKISIFPGSGCMHAPFFLKRQYIEGLQKINSFFPWRSPLMTYYPPNERKYRNYSLFCEMGGFWNKGRTPGERWPKCLQWTQLFSKISTRSITMLAEEKFVFQISKFSKFTLIWPYFRGGMFREENKVK